MTKIIAILGGDARQLALISFLRRAGHTVRSYGLPLADAFESWREAVSGAEVLVLPLPASTDGCHLHQPLSREQEAPLLSEVLKEIPEKCEVFSGKCSTAFREMAAEEGVTLTDYFESEVLQQKNALPTAEGAVFVLMRESDRTVKGMPIAVTGYGRVAKALTRLLLAMGAHVTVIARKRDAIRAACAKGAEGVLLTDKEALKAAMVGQTAVFNTVPYQLFDAEVLEEMDKETLLIDLASAPGGVDGEAASALGVKVIWALSLPGKYAPKTAGEIIGETLIAMMGEVEE